MSPATVHHEIHRRGANAPTASLFVAGIVLAIVGLGTFVALAMGDDPGRAWRLFLINFLFFTGVAQGAIVFAATQKITKGVWAGPIIRFAEAAALFLPVSVVCFLVLFLGKHHLFPWIEHPTPLRGNWLTVPWVFWRDLAALLALMVTSVAFVYHDLKPDVAELRDHVTGWKRALYDRIAGDYVGSPEQLQAVERRINWLAPLLCLLYAYLFSLLGFDLIMSLAPYWMSNLFGAFFFMGAFLTGLTMLGLMSVFWRWKLDMGAVIGREQLHDLGKLVFAFSIFWAYLMYSQLLVIWYGNLREETSFVFLRLWGDWRPIAILVGLMIFLIPFWGLIWVKAKINRVTFTTFLAISFVGVWLERYLLVQPSLTEAGPMFGAPEIAISLGFLGLFLLAYGLFARTFPMVSPRLLAKAELTGHH
ncbi:MAG: polysulfide reductase NrfD [Gemmatimonadota bacterium]|nr:polysulfide reductase NrfD [Gemmatimonadota bacterium]MDH3366239.1 polysulfide reductase NrfD [Gemmatimonadota bacterium]MDH3476802.1 polysulfide reductase NrfD [Gemmatimonadota bacterium]MDH3568630.1 polysulfide reductase NrfD [Gemmatimonadota bacterium]MDH5549571.1 polysulfide reductase NrfD [Gemmatimonadota bacterium]